MEGDLFDLGFKLKVERLFLLEEDRGSIKSMGTPRQAAGQGGPGASLPVFPVGGAPAACAGVALEPLVSPNGKADPLYRSSA